MVEIFLAASLMIAGPITARVTEVKDGDTLAAKADVWLHLTADVVIRLRGIDTPELNAPCAAARAKARAAKKRLAELVEQSGGKIILYNIAPGLYDRQIADVRLAGHPHLPDGQNVSALLLAENLARAGSKRQNWCPS